MKRKQIFGVNVGSSSILLIFIVLCLVSLAVLSLASTTTDYRLSQKVSERQIAYYDACSNAEHDLATTDQIFYHFSRSCSEEEFINHFDPAYTYIYPISDIQSLIVTITPSYTPIGHHFYQITRWQTVVNKDLDYDTTLHILQ